MSIRFFLRLTNRRWLIWDYDRLYWIIFVIRYFGKRLCRSTMKTRMLCDESAITWGFISTAEKRKILKWRIGPQSKRRLLSLDKFSNGYELLLSIRNSQIYASGTVNFERTYLAPLKEEKKIKRGELDRKQSNDVTTYFRLKDKETLSWLSSY